MFRSDELWNFDYGDIDANSNILHFFKHYSSSSEWIMLSLDPTEADTDGDGVNDGDELRDDFGRWPYHDDYCKAEDGSGDPDYSQISNPLDPTSFKR
ncbi:MAG: hypothetical protein U9R75_01655 [Candidatus Thermoplasmatota archaeon]|nr:hypothetical protein [Candidatus Thermoplasmatota archaeon]